MIRVGEDPASVSYVTGKEKAAEEIGVWTQTIVLPENATEKELLAKVKEMNKAEHVDGILVQLPLPKHINADKVLNLIDPAKDVDGFHPVNVGKMLIGDPYFMPCTPHGAVELMVRSGNQPRGQACGDLRPKQHRGQASHGHSGAEEQAGQRYGDRRPHRDQEHGPNHPPGRYPGRRYGLPEVITADMVKEGAVVIDVGVNRVGWKPSKKDPTKQVPDLGAM